MMANKMKRVADRSVHTLGQLCGAEYLPSLFNGRLVVLPKQAWNSVYDRYENYLSLWIRNYLTRGGTFMDVGAHFGLWSVFGAKLVGNKGRVVSLEPSPAFTTLEYATRRYPVIESLKLGLGSKEGSMTFFAQGDSKSGSFSKQVTEVNAPYQPDISITAQAIAVRTLDALSTEIELRPNLIKIDVEGFEIEVLKGAAKLLQRCSPAMLIEIHPLQLRLQGSTEGEIFDLLVQYGYDFEVIHRDPNSIYTIRAQRKSLRLSRA